MRAASSLVGPYEWCRALCKDIYKPAFAWLRRASMSRRVAVGHIARAVVPLLAKCGKHEANALSPSVALVSAAGQLDPGFEEEVEGDVEEEGVLQSPLSGCGRATSWAVQGSWQLPRQQRWAIIICGWE